MSWEAWEWEVSVHQRCGCGEHDIDGGSAIFWRGQHWEPNCAFAAALSEVDTVRESLREVLLAMHFVYPALAGRAYYAQAEGEERAAALWTDYATRLYDAAEKARKTLDE